ncbi:MFS transporter [Ktedonosporobacter rubrisoli]|uniref:MFS transporter n=1 Tax=Ktedonosporobacter rubrisoli TaxID=2509675 RepID=A0A4P6JP79_KTERU|nr:MFS transporter [Ktedonosporobacter rubrisoli]QBD77179.1 MFS transporter [Ktedonosporobacter rubrisoli]
MRHSSQKYLARSSSRFLLINRNYTFLWIGSAISYTGDVLFLISLTLWIGTLLQNQSYAPLAISGIGLSAALPALLISPFAGVFVDRWQKQKIMRFMDVIRAILVLSLLLVSGPGPLPFFSASTSVLPIPMKLGIIYLVVGAQSSLSQFFNPSTKALLREIVPEERLTQASALTTGTAFAVWPVGSALAGICYANLGVNLAILLNAASFICSWVLIRSMHVSEPAPSLEGVKQGLHHVFKELWEGFQCIEGNLLLRTLLCAESLLAFGFGIYNTMGFFFITQNLHVPVSLYGLFNGVQSFGGILGTWLISRSATTRGHPRVYYTARVLAGIAMMVTAFQSQPLIALVGMVIISIAHSCTEALVGPLILGATPEKMEGRVFSTFGTATTISSLLATFLSGYLSSTLLHPVAFHASFITLNAASILTSCAGIALLGGGLYASKHFRKMKSAEM